MLIGQVTAMRRKQEDARKRLADAFSAMSAYIQRYRCQESEFDLGAALMNPMADCEWGRVGWGRGGGVREVGLWYFFCHAFNVLFSMCFIISFFLFLFLYRSRGKGLPSPVLPLKKNSTKQALLRFKTSTPLFESYTKRTRCVFME